MRPILKAQNPGITALEITKLLGRKWNSATESEKAPFVKLETKSRSAYMYAVNAWLDKKGPNAKKPNELITKEMREIHHANKSPENNNLSATMTKNANFGNDANGSHLSRESDDVPKAEINEV
mmetsp:Transcript_42227/g.51433  ORF Transcript_42227/g.51433 Transcript_42227/m.51433 type:complete len:123 (+) Transcript_42227:413-781(+)